MIRLLKATLELGKSIIARPKKIQEPNLHWVKATKPIDEMSKEERTVFSNELAKSILENAKKHNH